MNPSNFLWPHFKSTQETSESDSNFDMYVSHCETLWAVHYRWPPATRVVSKTITVTTVYNLKTDWHNLSGMTYGICKSTLTSFRQNNRNLFSLDGRSFFQCCEKSPSLVSGLRVTPSVLHVVSLILMIFIFLHPFQYGWSTFLSVIFV